ncbi:MAG TPA: preprotein translocase subunit SecG [Allosphingosinicella sp.]|jgi:preprotein translocase subunit SecG
MGLFTFLLIVQTLVALAMVAVILMQRSEGGGLVGGGSPSGMMSARGASDFLTRSTAILAAIFVALSIVLAALAARQGGPRQIDPAAAQPRSPVPQQGPTQPIPGLPGAVVPTGPTSPQQGSAPGAIPGAGTPAAPGLAPPAAVPPAAPAGPGNKQ